MFFCSFFFFFKKLLKIQKWWYNITFLHNVPILKFIIPCVYASAWSHFDKKKAWVVHAQIPQWHGDWQNIVFQRGDSPKEDDLEKSTSFYPYFLELGLLYGVEHCCVAAEHYYGEATCLLLIGKFSLIQKLTVIGSIHDMTFDKKCMETLLTVQPERHWAQYFDITTLPRDLCLNGSWPNLLCTNGIETWYWCWEKFVSILGYSEVN